MEAHSHSCICQIQPQKPLSHTHGAHLNTKAHMTTKDTHCLIQQLQQQQQSEFGFLFKIENLEPESERLFNV